MCWVTPVHHGGLFAFIGGRESEFEHVGKTTDGNVREGGPRVSGTES
jgi:hypothetical protein